jgi:transposase
VRFIGLDVHRDFCEVAISDGGKARSAGRIDTSPQALELFASSLAPDDRVVLESTGNALAIAGILEPHVAEVVVANPMQVRAICHAKVKNDRFDARTLAELLAVDLIPRVWITDERTRALRRLTSRRAQLVRQRTRVKNEVSAVLVRNLKGRPPVSDVFGKRGRRWLAELELPADEHDTVAACLRQIDFLDTEIAGVDGHLATHALASTEIKRLMTIPGIDVTTAATVMAAIGDIRRFPSAKKLVGYLGLDARVRQSGVSAARHGRISKEDRPPCVTCSCRPPGLRSRPRGRCARSISASKPAAARRSRSSPSRANSRCSAGNCSPLSRITPTSAPRSSPASCAHCNCASANRRPPRRRRQARDARPQSNSPPRNATSPSKPNSPTGA